jgi:hypothetical protein
MRTLLLSRDKILLIAKLGTTLQQMFFAWRQVTLGK